METVFIQTHSLIQDDGNAYIAERGLYNLISKLSSDFYIPNYKLFSKVHSIYLKEPWLYDNKTGYYVLYAKTIYEALEMAPNTNSRVGRVEIKEDSILKIPGRIYNIGDVYKEYISPLCEPLDTLEFEDYTSYNQYVESQVWDYVVFEILPLFPDREESLKETNKILTTYMRFLWAGEFFSSDMFIERGRDDLDIGEFYYKTFKNEYYGLVDEFLVSILLSKDLESKVELSKLEKIVKDIDFDM